MAANETLTLQRECEAIEIPYGNKIVLPAGIQVTLMQSLGGTYTVRTEQGYLARIAGHDADALGLQPAASPPATTEPAAAVDAEDLERQVWDQLRTVYDPEIPVNVVDLGLVYECAVTPLPEGGNRVGVKMTLTAPGCGMGDVLKADAEYKIRNLQGVKEAHVEMVVEPPWNPSMMSEAARLQLGYF